MSRRLGYARAFMSYGGKKVRARNYKRKHPFSYGKYQMGGSRRKGRAIGRRKFVI